MDSEYISKYIIVKGIVQGVGFRPFVYKIARENNLLGDVKNTSKGVYINIEGSKKSISEFVKNLKEKPPQLAKIEEIYIEDKKIRNYKDFKIIKSNKEDGLTIISPDIAICQDCIKDINNINDKRRYKYAFTNCTNCGPRFSIIKNLPYDRKETSMKEFLMCEKCEDEYNNPLNRRFHAQPTCCKDCGPSLRLLDKYGEEIKIEGDKNNINENILEKTKKLLKEGNIIAIKGLGGFHLACSGKNYSSIELLRNRKHRKSKPLALMMKDLNTVNKYCYVNAIEENILLGTKKPILILNKKNNILPKNISYNNPTLGVMLPYTPLHYLLFDEELDILVMTSGNISGLPMISENKVAVNSLGNVADYYLVHNRHIHMPVDDSVVKVVLNEERVIRSARGYSPMNYRHKVKDTLALGSELKNTFSISKSCYIFMSQYIGDISSIETLNNITENIRKFIKIYDIKPKMIAYDNHPSFIYKDYIKKIPCEKVGVYHHHAHIVSCMFENKVEEKVIGLAFDGVGYGRDNHIWGSEFLICDYKDFIRVGHLKYFKMPGGDNATKKPWKMALSLINEVDEKSEFINEILNYSRLNHLKNKNYKLILSMLNNNINSPLSSSMGRFFDGVSGMLGFEEKITFEGEACIALENLAQKYVECNDFYKFNINYINNEFIINTNSIVKSILEDLKNNKCLEFIAIKFHNTVVEFSLDLCKKIRSLYKINKVALSGGVFQNNIIFTKLHNKLEEEKFQVLTHKLLPCNDSSISVGQLIIANNRRENHVCSNSG